MPEIAPGIHLQFSREVDDPYNWGGEGNHGETNPIRNYAAACRDAAHAAPLGWSGVDYGVRTNQEWSNQATEAEEVEDQFDDIGEDGIPTVVPRELVQLQEKLNLERPDLHIELRIDRNGIPSSADKFNITLGAYAQPERFAHTRVTPQVEATKLEWGSEQGELAPAAGWRTGSTTTDPYDVGTTPSPDWDRAERQVLKTARSLPGEWQGGRLAGLPEHGIVTVTDRGGIDVTPTAEQVELEDIQNGIGGYVEAVPLASDLSMWVDEEGAFNGLDVNKGATYTAGQFQINHQAYRGNAVFTGGPDAEGNTLALDRGQLAAVKEIAEFHTMNPSQQNPAWEWTRGAELADGTFDTRANNGLPTTLRAMDSVREAAMQEQQRAAMEQLPQAPSGTGPGVS